MRRLPLLITFLLCSLPSFAAATQQNIHIDWDYTPPDGYTVSGFRLYQEGMPVCSVDDATAVSMDCDVNSDAAQATFTLKALFTDGSESPPSPPYTFNFGTTTTEPPIGTGSHNFTFTWQNNGESTSIANYRIYLNDEQLCQTDDSITTTITCSSDLLQEPMSFSVTALYTDGSESTPSNLLLFDPTEYSQFFSAKLLFFSWEYPETTDLTGFRVYQDNKLLCETTNAEERNISCTADITSSNTMFAVTAVDSSGNETSLSNTLTYSTEAAPSDTALQAIISTNINEGQVPLTVSFDSALSTGSISSYAWSFGDGSTADTSATDYTYTLPGTYTAVLTLTDPDGSTSTATVLITVQEGSANTPPPVAVISSSGSVGDAPLAVSFNAADSSAPDSTITSYSWDFGDGTTATGSNTTHTFLTAGTFTTTLTVTNREGLTDLTSTPVMVTSSTDGETNQAPTASFTTTTVSGPAPLTITFNGTDSSDQDGTIATFFWNFGDGSSGEGASITHTYTTAASYTVSLQVTDNDGATASASTAISATTEEQQANFNVELGEVSVNGNWIRIDFSSSFNTPVVIAGPASNGDTESGIIRLRNIDSTGFEIKFEEWDYLDGNHGNETVSFLVMERGSFTLDDGTLVEAGTFGGTTAFQAHSFSHAFNTTPVIATTVASNNETSTIAGRIRNVTPLGFEYYFREQEANTNTHAVEAVNYISWEESRGTLGNLIYEVQKTSDAVTGYWKEIQYQTNFSQAPLLLADIQTTNGSDTAGIRVQLPTEKSIQLKIAEEQSKDEETGHTTEVIGYLAFTSTNEISPPETGQNEKEFTFHWEYNDSSSNTSGFLIYLNDVLLCETQTATDRELSCTAPLLEQTMNFTLTAVFSDGTETTPSNLLRFEPADLQESTQRTAVFNWEFDEAQEENITGFAILLNGNKICETDTPTSRKLSCVIDMQDNDADFSISALQQDGTSSIPSNIITFAP